MEQVNNRNMSFELLVDYVEGLLDSATNSRIEAQLEKDEYHRGVVEGIRFYYEKYGEDRAALDQYLSEFQQSLAKRTGVSGQRRRITPVLLSLAAVFLLLIVFAAPIRNALFSVPNDQLVAQALQEPYGNVYSPVKSDNNDSIRTSIGEFYERADYEGVIRILEVFLTRVDEIKTEDYLVLGLSYLYQKDPNYAQAITNLEKAQGLGDSITFQDQIKWYLALSHFQAGNKTEAKALFENIANNEGHYQKESARKILNQL